MKRGEIRYADLSPTVGAEINSRCTWEFSVELAMGIAWK
jgi:hypothetical protein